MPITVSLERELKHVVVDNVLDLTDAIVRLGREAQGERPLELLHFVDPYGHNCRCLPRFAISNDFLPRRAQSRKGKRCSALKD
jgi:hypothetical protein